MRVSEQVERTTGDNSLEITKRVLVELAMAPHYMTNGDCGDLNMTRAEEAYVESYIFAYVCYVVHTVVAAKLCHHLPF